MSTLTGIVPPLDPFDAALLAQYSPAGVAPVNPLIEDHFAICPAYNAEAQKTFFTVGDSKTVGWVNPHLRCGGFGWQPYLAEALTVVTGKLWREIRPRAAHGGYTCAMSKAVIDADLAIFPANILMPDFILVNIGANDAPNLPAHDAFVANLGYILDALHARFPVPAFLATAWRKGYIANCNTIFDWNGEVIAAREWAFRGADERAFLSDPTLTLDGIHPNTLGNIMTAAQWQKVLGY